MGQYIFSEEKSNPVNIKIRDIWAAKSFDECQKLCRELFELGFNDGQICLQKLRQGQVEKPRPFIAWENGKLELKNGENLDDSNQS